MRFILSTGWLSTLAQRPRAAVEFSSLRRRLASALLEFTSSVQPERVISLTIYLAVLVYSTAVAAYYLLLNRETHARGAM
jgi:hypothetical protein